MTASRLRTQSYVSCPLGKLKLLNFSQHHCSLQLPPSQQHHPHAVLEVKVLLGHRQLGCPWLSLLLGERWSDGDVTLTKSSPRYESEPDQQV